MNFIYYSTQEKLSLFKTFFITNYMDKYNKSN